MITGDTIAAAVGVVAVALVAGWLLPARAQAAALLAGGVATLALLSPPALAFLGAASLATYAAVRAARLRTAARLAAGAVISASYLYLLWRSGAGGPGRLVLPLGMAFSVLRLLHYLFEFDHRGFRSHTLSDYLAYQFLPAGLVIGPINRFDDFLRDLRRRRWDPDRFAAGASRVLQGVATIVLVGNFVFTGKLAPWLTEHAAPWPLLAAYVSTVIFWLNIYIQFSGYSSVAIGAGAMMGFALPENFNLPFLARNIGEFWRRWHISLSSWCRDYVYTPILARWRRPAVAMVSSMLVLGVWHEVSLHYVIWGVYHGLGLTVWRRFQGWYEPREPRLPRLAAHAWTGLAHALTLNFVMFSYPVANVLERMLVTR